MVDESEDRELPPGHYTDADFGDPFTVNDDDAADMARAFHEWLDRQHAADDADDPLFAGGQGRDARDVEQAHDGLRVTVVFVVLAVLVWLIATGLATGWALSKN